MITAIAASGGVSMPVSMRGMSIASSALDTGPLISAPPISTPRMIDTTVVPSIQPLATTSCRGGRSSVRMPYFAGEYAAAPRPTIAYATSGWNIISISEQPTILMPLVISITRPLGIESASAPTSGASRTYEMTKHCLSAGVIHAGDSRSRNNWIAATSSALSASDEKNCAAIIV